MTKTYFGNIEGKDVFLYTLKNDKIRLSLTEYAAAVVGINAFGTEIGGGFEKAEDYLADKSNHGASVGRVANRIDGCSFTMDGRTYSLPDNDKGATLHGGRGFSKRLWELSSADERSVVFRYFSPDGEEGFPADLEVYAKYSLTEYGFMIDYTAIPSGKTPISLTNHAYFNLDGFGGSVKEHKAIIYADRYTEINDRLLPTGERPRVDGTLFDFKELRSFAEMPKNTDGYDHNFLLSPTSFKCFGEKRLALAAEMLGKEIKMTLYTDRPCVHLYTGNGLGNGPDYKGGIKQTKHGAFCLETQTEPGGVKRGQDFYSPDGVYRHTSVYEFTKL